MQSQFRFQELLDDYTGDSAGPQERAELLQMVRSGEYQGVLEEHIAVTFGAENLEGPVLSTWQKEKILQNIFAEARLAAPVIDISMNRGKRLTWRWAAAAAILVTVTIGAGLYYRSLRSGHELAVAPAGSGKAQEEAITPGGYRAVLTLADATEVSLDKAGDKGAWTQGGTQVLNRQGEELVYTTAGATGNNANNVSLYNKVSTPRGGQYRIVLPDGSKVWLNAASTLRFPIAFAGEERNVQLTGEAYFEINPHPAGSGREQRAPFTVSFSNGAKVMVLGTHFNVMAYDDEQATQTTLLEGAVKISSGRASSLLKPGQQAQIQSFATGLGSPAGITVRKADAGRAVAWKNGFFSGADVPALMRQVARWYNVEVVYKSGTPPAKQFGGEISRKSTIADLVTLLETNGIHVSVEAKTRKLVVLN